jgi:hypothetical protein
MPMRRMERTRLRATPDKGALTVTLQTVFARIYKQAKYLGAPGRTLWLAALPVLLVVLLVNASADEGQSSSELRTLYGTPSESGNYVAMSHGLPELNESATLSDYLEYAALSNPGLEAAFNDWKRAVEKVPQVRSLPDPRFTYAYYIQEVETRVGPQRQAAFES